MNMHIICSIYTHVQVLLIKDINCVVGITFGPIEIYNIFIVHVMCILGKESHFRHMSDRICTFSMEMYEYVCTSFMETYAVANDVEFLVLVK